VTLVFELPEPGVARVHVEREELEHVILNLAANARDAMPSGGRLVITATRIAPDASRGGEDRVALTVLDDGVGMTPEVRARAFDRFFTSKEQGRGTGLGLASAHRFATRYGGRIAIRSEPNRGTEVTLELPRASCDRTTVRPPRVSP
ncbi:MAG: sensor histidine kinase, partial [Polyangiales bacterium]